jgi:hypothetical protein
MCGGLHIAAEYGIYNAGKKFVHRLIIGAAWRYRQAIYYGKNGEC